MKNEMATVCGSDRKGRRRRKRGRRRQLCVAVTGRGEGGEEDKGDGNYVWQ
jgi:hypothetical protein